MVHFSSQDTSQSPSFYLSIIPELIRAWGVNRCTRDGESKEEFAPTKSQSFFVYGTNGGTSVLIL
uniref:Uncharacterized protein n=1 Tax=Solanum lycopersicum TaxID=4081 RepID=A0A3Q7FZ90_SOLLC